jgi:hypothetical protein
MSAPHGPDATRSVDPSSRPAVLAFLMVLVALTVVLLLAAGRDVPAGVPRSCPAVAANTQVTAPPTGTVPC